MDLLKNAPSPRRTVAAVLALLAAAAAIPLPSQAAPGPGACDFTSDPNGDTTPFFGPGNDPRGANSCVMNGQNNVAEADDSGIFVGIGNRVRPGATNAFIAGGEANFAGVVPPAVMGHADSSVSVGGEDNQAWGRNSALLAGNRNLAGADQSVIAGGTLNTIQGPLGTQLANGNAVDAIVLGGTWQACQRSVWGAASGMALSRIAVAPATPICPPNPPPPPQVPPPVYNVVGVGAPDAVAVLGQDILHYGTAGAIIGATRSTIGDCPNPASGGPPPVTSNSAIVLGQLSFIDPGSDNSATILGNDVQIGEAGTAPATAGAPACSFPNSVGGVPNPFPNLVDPSVSVASGSADNSLTLRGNRYRIDIGSDNSVIGSMGSLVNGRNEIGDNSGPARNSLIVGGYRGSVAFQGDNAITFGCFLNLNPPLPPFPIVQTLNQGGFIGRGCDPPGGGITAGLNGFVGWYQGFVTSDAQQNGAVFLATGSLAGTDSAVLGGAGNQASGNSFVGRGGGNQAFGNSFVGQGTTNQAVGGSFVGAGSLNRASAGNSVILGGASGQVLGNLGVSLGGDNGNKALATASTVLGGSRNTASGNFASAFSGVGGVAQGANSFVAGGDRNQASGDFSSVWGGRANAATGASSAVAGGSGHLASGAFATVLGGQQNRASAQAATAIGQGALADVYGGVVHSSIGVGASPASPAGTLGTAQAGEYVLLAKSVNSGPQPLSVDGAGGKLMVRKGSSWTFTADVVAHVPGASASHSWEVSGVVRHSSAGPVLVAATVHSLYTDPSASGWRVTVSVDPTGALVLTGTAVPLVRWVATVQTAESGIL